MNNFISTIKRHSLELWFIGLACFIINRIINAGTLAVFVMIIGVIAVTFAAASELYFYFKTAKNSQEKKFRKLMFGQRLFIILLAIAAFSWADSIAKKAVVIGCLFALIFIDVSLENQNKTLAVRKK